MQSYPAPPVARTRRLNCLAQDASSLRWSYWRHSHQSAAFESPADKAGTGHHSGSHTPCTVSLTLRCNSHVGRTFSSEPDRHVRSSRPGIVSSALAALISRARIQKLPSTHPGQVFPDSAPSLLRLTGKGLTPLSSLSFSCSAFSADTRMGVTIRLVGVATARLPTPACVSRTCRALHPIGHDGFGPSPTGGFGVPWSSAPALDKTDLPHCSGRRVPLARIQLRIFSWDRIRRLLFVGDEGLLPKASLELDDPLSWKIQLYGTLA